MSARHCGACTLCCKLLPQTELSKPAGQRCQHQRMGQGCRIYAKRPPGCRAWSCAWLSGDDTDLRRPDFSHAVVDIMPDFITAVPHDGSPSVKIPVVQVWVDPKYRDAHLDPGLRAYLARRGEEDGMAALIRYDSTDGFVLIPPALTGAGWAENHGGIFDREHTAEEKFAAFPEHMVKAVEGAI